MRGKKLIPAFKRNHWLVNQQTKGLSHKDSMLTLPFYDNCMNWVVGHIVHYRDKVLSELGERPSMAEAETALYQRESKPVTDSEQAVPLPRLLAALDDTQKRLSSILAEVTDEALAAVHDEERQSTVGDRLEFLLWHETYHVGQLEILRQLAGAQDAII